jgi:NADP-dependent 3-hydroxy acid dehydrogenase YdfG
MTQHTTVVAGVGANTGLGAAVCRHFAAAGHHVMVAGRTLAKIGAVAKSIRDAGGSAEAFYTGTADEAQVSVMCFGLM